MPTPAEFRSRQQAEFNHLYKALVSRVADGEQHGATYIAKLCEAAGISEEEFERHVETTRAKRQAIHALARANGIADPTEAKALRTEAEATLERLIPGSVARLREARGKGRAAIDEHAAAVAALERLEEPAGVSVSLADYGTFNPQAADAQRGYQERLRFIEAEIFRTRVKRNKLVQEAAAVEAHLTRFVFPGDSHEAFPQPAVEAEAKADQFAAASAAAQPTRDWRDGCTTIGAAPPT